jgi:multiple sugar transport system ATP-binding protein
MRPHSVASQCPFEVTPEVTEPLGMETLVFFNVNGTEMCARTNPAANTQPGVRTRLLADLNHMHLIDEASGRVL